MIESCCQFITASLICSFLCFSPAPVWKRFHRLQSSKNSFDMGALSGLQSLVVSYSNVSPPWAPSEYSHLHGVLCSVEICSTVLLFRSCRAISASPFSSMGCIISALIFGVLLLPHFSLSLASAGLYLTCVLFCFCFSPVTLQHFLLSQTCFPRGAIILVEPNNALWWGHWNWQYPA